MLIILFVFFINLVSCASLGGLMKTIKYLVFAYGILLAGCSTLILKPADFAWPIESVLKVDDNGNVQEKRFSFSFNTSELFLNETGDSLGYKNKELRIIRDGKGYYFMTADNFKDVYVFNAIDGTFSLKNKIEISDSTGMENPALNQRLPYIELIYGNRKINLTDEGIEESK
jgi:hypothetical protein